MTLLLLVCCSGALAEHVHDIYVKIITDWPATAPLDEMNRPKDFTVQLYSSQASYSCTIGMCDLNGWTTIPMSSMTFTFAGYEAASALATCETKGSYRFDGPTVEVMIDNVLYTTKPYIYLITDALGHDWSNKDCMCARSGCGAVCDHTASKARPTCEQGAVCDACGKTLAALGHDDHAEVTSPSCGQKGFTTYTCTRCNRSYTADETPALSHVYGEWNPEGDGTSSARCMRCKHKAKADCEMLSFTLKPSEESAEAVNFALCPVCGAVTTGQRLTLAKGAKNAQAPAGTLAVRMGEAADGVQVLMIATERAGHLLQPAETIAVLLPASLMQGLTLSLLAADGMETPLTYTVEGETISFTLSFTDADGQPIAAQAIRLLPEG